ncbi:MAG: BTAD domain-containing putative transcriptional regulator [Spirochaetia bacterium]
MMKKGYVWRQHSFLPPSLEKTLRREHLISYLRQRSKRRVFLFHGMLGTGKSILAADFLSSETLPFIWINPTEECTSSADFLSLVFEAFTRTVGIDSAAPEPPPGPKVEEEDLEILLKGVLESAKKLSLEFSESSGKAPDIFFVIDNLDSRCGNRDFTDFLEYFIEELPREYHFILIYSSIPSGLLSNIRAEKELVELREEDFLFTERELADLAEAKYQLSLDGETIKRIGELTEGWITPCIYLFEELYLKDEETRSKILNHFFKTKRLTVLDAFFREHFSNHLDGKEFVHAVTLSVFDSFDSDLLRYFFDSEGEALLSKLLDRHLFLLPAGTERYRYHPLLREYLAKLFSNRREEEKIPHYRAAAKYFTGKRETEKAVRFYASAGSLEEAKNHFIPLADELLETNSYGSLKTLLAYFPEEEKETDLYMAYYDGIVANLVKPFSSREKLLSLLDAFHRKKDYTREARIFSELLTNYLFYFEQEELINELIEKASAFIAEYKLKLEPSQCEILNTLIALGTGSVYPGREESFETALRAEETSYRFHNFEAFLCARLVLTKLYIDRGEFYESLDLLEKTERVFEDSEEAAFYKPLLSFFIGDAHFYLGEIDKAVDRTRKALGESNPTFAFRRFLELNLIYYLLYSEEVAEAEELFEGFRRKQIANNPYAQYFWIYLLQMLISYRKGNKLRAEYYCKRLMEDQNENLLRADFPFGYLSLSEVCLFLDKPEAVRIYLSRILDDTPPNSYPYPRATAEALAGLLAHKEGRKKEAAGRFASMAAILDAKGYRNLDICNPKLLLEIAEASGKDFTSFHRYPRPKAVSTDPFKGKEVPFYFKTLGAFQIFQEGKEIPASVLTRQKRVIDLLKLILVFRKNGISKEVVYDVFWPRYSYKSARDNLNTVVYRLRKILSNDHELLSTEMNIIKLNEEFYAADVDDFLECLDRAKRAEKEANPSAAIELYETAAGLYTGDFLEGGFYHDYLRDERENLKNRYRQSLFSLARLCLKANRPQKGFEWANRLISKDPLCEPAYRLSMIASVAIGNRTAITRIYEKLDAALSEQYGIAADPKTVELKDRLLAGTPPSEMMWRNETVL